MPERGVWIVTKTGLVPKHLYHRPIQTRSDLPAPMLIRDCMDPTINHADGKRYDSKRAYEKAVRAAGCVIVGNEKMTRREAAIPDPVEDVKRAIEIHESKTPTRRTRKRK